jgi:hypothetical protein
VGGIFKKAFKNNGFKNNVIARSGLPRRGNRKYFGRVILGLRLLRRRLLAITDMSSFKNIQDDFLKALPAKLLFCKPLKIHVTAFIALHTAVHTGL